MEATQLSLVAQPRPTTIREAVAPLTDEDPLHRLFQHGEDTLSDADLVALICDIGVPEARVLLGHGLASLAARSWRFGPRDERSRTDAARMAASLELGRRIAGQAWSEPVVVRTADDLARGLVARYGHRVQEHLVCVFLDARHHVICEEVLFVGTIDTALVSTREPIAAALAVNAKAIILAHNHPAGDPSPSPQDIAYSTKLKDACALFDIELLDHIIVARTRHGSMLGQGYL